MQQGATAGQIFNAKVCFGYPVPFGHLPSNAKSPKIFSFEMLYFESMVRLAIRPRMYKVKCLLHRKV